ncbi:expressed unknown protein [Seminavis robusta]|uniref:Uncharacterized protein n=1 Tax=Seminavis robusta TaxID=568900 RepID=A0A9N8F396_9STRA|nr:expressed unknown protein [Seminavis robusta]|eukprot:Sro3324_g346820.1 n/a (359) ;mRNA; r:5013-6089
MSNCASPQINFQQVKEQWRTATNGMKVRSLANNSRRLCGGFFVLNEHGNAATLGFCYEAYHKNYGITVAHLADYVDADGNVVRVGQVGGKLYAFDSDEPDANGVHAQVEIGTIVSIDRATDSMLFEVRPEVRIEPRVLNVSRGQNATFPEEAISIPPSPGQNGSSSTLFTTLAGFGAQRRRALGRVVGQISSTEANSGILEEDLCIQSFDPNDDNDESHASGKVPLTDGGDCGMFLLDVYANLWGMHHVLRYKGSTREYTSCCVPIKNILEAPSHKEFFPQHKDSALLQSSPRIIRSSSLKENSQPALDDDCVVLNKPLTFKTKTKELAPYHQDYSHQPKLAKTKIVPLAPFGGNKAV